MYKLLIIKAKKEKYKIKENLFILTLCQHSKGIKDNSIKSTRHRYFFFLLTETLNDREGRGVF